MLPPAFLSPVGLFVPVGCTLMPILFLSVSPNGRWQPSGRCCLRPGSVCASVRTMSGGLKSMPLSTGLVTAQEARPRQCHLRMSAWGHGSGQAARAALPAVLTPVLSAPPCRDCDCDFHVARGLDTAGARPRMSRCLACAQVVCAGVTRFGCWPGALWGGGGSGAWRPPGATVCLPQAEHPS